MTKPYLILALLAFLAAGHTAWGQSTFSVEANGNQFTIRSNTSGTQKVYYRTVSLSAMERRHFASIYDSCTFTPGVLTSKTITVSEKTPGDEAFLFQTGTSRSYRFEVVDEGGFVLASADRTMTTGTSVPGSGAFNVKDLIIHSNEYSADDRGYAKNGYQSMPSSNFFDNAAPQAYYSAINAQLRMTLSFKAKEEDDAFEYVQILVDNTSTCDNRTGKGIHDGNPGNPSLSRYMAGFEMHTGKKDDAYKSYTFPVTSVGNGKSAANPWGHGDGYPLTLQNFNTNCRATDGRLILPVSFSSLVLRLNASGTTGSDQWWAKDVKAHIQAVDNNAPYVLFPRVSSGKHARGNPIYVSLAFSEIVTITGDKKLTTSWGDLSYVEGSGSNVLTFKGDISQSAEGLLNITGLSGVIADLAGKSLDPNAVKIKNLCSLENSNVYAITYDLAGGNESTPNPDAYSYDASVTIDYFPVKPGYVFVGWTGSNGSTPQTTVTIPAGEHGDKHYTANWTPVWGQDQDADGTEAHPYVITTTEGLDMLAKVVDGLDGYTADGYSGTYFALGNDISYSYAGLGPQQSNFTPIGGYFNGGDKDFKGIFYGRGHTISGIRIYSPLSNQNINKNKGLFGRTTGAIIRNVTISDARITGYSFVGGIVGNSSSSTIANCFVIGSRFTYSAKNGGVILGCKNNGSLTTNYYRDCTVTVGSTTCSTDIGVGTGSTASSDQGGTYSLHTLTLSEHITASGNSVQIGNTTYYPSTTPITLSYADPPEGGHINYSYNDGTDHAISGTSFAMPSADITVSASLTSALENFHLVRGTKDGVTAWWGTFYDSGYNYTLSEGAAAYTLGSDHHLYRLGDDGRTIPKGTAVVIISTVPDATLSLAGTDKLSIAIHGKKNILIGSDIDKTYAAFCVLSAGASGEIGFFTLEDITVPAYKAGYLPPTNGGLEDYNKQDNQKW